MRRKVGLLLGAAWSLALGCSLFGNVDDLKGDLAPDASASGGASGSAGSGTGGASSCTAEKGCKCASCADYCRCSRPLAIQACLDEECVDGGAGSAGASGAAGGDGGEADGDAADGGFCEPELYLNAECGQASKLEDCSACLSSRCCDPFESCFAAEDCAALASCTERECGWFNGECGREKGCFDCLRNTSEDLLSEMAACARQNCGLPCQLCQPLGENCSTGEDCCSNQCGSASSCCAGAGAPCSTPGDCCSGSCVDNLCCKPIGAACGANEECCSALCAGNCFIIT
jgi:hypothetical protein